MSVTNKGNYSCLYDVTAGVPAVLEETRPGGTVVQYFRTPSGTLIASRIKNQGNGDPTRYYLFDAQGSTRCIADSTGAVTDRYVYDVYGKCIAHSGPTTDNPYQYVGALGYYTHYQDPELKLLQLGFRFYDPETGRFTQQDPAKSGINWYAYCGGNPARRHDPWGLEGEGSMFNPDGLAIDLPGEEMDGVPMEETFALAGVANASREAEPPASPAVPQVGETCSEASGAPGPPADYPSIPDLKTGEPIPFPEGPLERIPPDQKVPWGSGPRQDFINEWNTRGYATPPGGWSPYDIHHIRPREFGGGNEFDNLTPVLRPLHQEQFNPFWRSY